MLNPCRVRKIGVFSQGDAVLALGYRMYKPFGLFKTPIDPVDHNHPSHKFGRCTCGSEQKSVFGRVSLDFRIPNKGQLKPLFQPRKARKIWFFALFASFAVFWVTTPLRQDFCASCGLQPTVSASLRLCAIILYIPVLWVFVSLRGIRPLAWADTQVRPYGLVAAALRQVYLCLSVWGG